MSIEFLWFIIAGFLSGILGGMGMGGGTLLIPVLTIFLKTSQHVAQAVNLVSFIPLGIVALIVHLKNKLVRKNGLLYIITPALICSILLSLLSLKIEGKVLTRFFGAFLLVLSFVQFFSHKIIKKFNK